MASGCYSQGLIEVVDGTLDWKTTPSVTWKAQLTQSSYSPNKETHEDLADVSASKVTGTTDQTLTGANLGNPTEDLANNRVEMDYTTTLVWTSVGPGPAETVGYVIFYHDDGGVAANSALLCFCDFVSNITTNGSDITVTINAEGVWALVYGA